MKRFGLREIVLGFTGTQRGMNFLQQKAFRRFVEEIKPSVFHHGDCIGADEEAHDIVAECGVKNVVIHPPEVAAKRAFCHKKKREVEVEVLDEFAYLERNRHIVDDSDLLVAVPKANVEEQRSGTWSTVRYARKSGKPVFIIWPE